MKKIYEKKDKQWKLEINKIVLHAAGSNQVPSEAPPSDLPREVPPQKVRREISVLFRTLEILSFIQDAFVEKYKSRFKR